MIFNDLFALFFQIFPVAFLGEVLNFPQEFLSPVNGKFIKLKGDLKPVQGEISFIFIGIY